MYILHNKNEIPFTMYNIIEQVCVFVCRSSRLKKINASAEPGKGLESQSTPYILVF